ncbi:hypothetical protein ACP4OV_014576 [Aristida adscensionis]
MAVGDALRRLCEEIGWSYAVFWKAIGAADPVHLVWEDGYCGHTSCPAGSEASEALATEGVGCAAAADTICSLVKKVMASQVHVVSEGTIGRAAFSGNHQWIVHGTANGHGLSSEVAAEMNNQFKAGIQTIAIIPVLPRGVLQLGSTGLVMENTNFVMYAKKLCSQLNNRSSIAASTSVKNSANQHSQSRSLHGAFHLHSDDSCSKISSRPPVASEQYICPNTAVSSSALQDALLNASLLKIAQQNGRLVGDNIVYTNPDVRLMQQAPYYEGRLGGNRQSVAMSSGLNSQSLPSVRKQSQLNNIGLLEFSNSSDLPADLARNILLKSLVCRDPSIHENVNITPHQQRYEVSSDTNGPGNYDFAPRVGRANLCTTGTSSQVLDQGCHSTSGALLQKQPQVPCKVPQSSEFSAKLQNPERGSLQACSVPSSESDGQVSNGLNTGKQKLINRLNHSCHDQKMNRVNPSANLSTEKMRNGDGCGLPGMPNERDSSLLVEPTADNDLFDIFGAEFHQFSQGVDADLISWSGAKSQNSDRDVPESSIYLDSSQLFSSLENGLHCSGTFSLTDTDQLLDAVISNVNPGSKHCPDDSASCKTSLIDMPSTSDFGSRELKRCESFGAPSVLIKHEAPQFVKQPCLFDKPEDGCLSQNNGTHKSQIRLWIESGQNLKCESASASNSKGLDTPSKSNRKRSRPGESTKPRPKDRQLIQDRIKELRELVPNGAKCSIDALLEKTVKHMLFLQSVTKNADKLKDSTESKILGGENGPLWKDYFEGGATWAFDVGSQSMTCPIIVEDLDRPRQMLVEMLCEDRGIFLEIADFIKGLGLTILRGVMEVRKSKIWARFTVEANRDVTRMEIFLSLVRLLEPNCDGSAAAENANNVNMPLGLVHQPVIPATGHIQ